MLKTAIFLGQVTNLPYEFACLTLTLNSNSSSTSQKQFDSIKCWSLAGPRLVEVIL